MKVLAVVRVDKYGRILIPKRIRDMVGMVPGEYAEMKVYKQGIMITPLHTKKLGKRQ